MIDSNKVYKNYDLQPDRQENCISLGWFCATASSMSLYGLRNFSGPFDWCTSDLESVLKVIETDFMDFLNKDNLQIYNGSPKAFYDIKYGFVYVHDVEDNFEKDYPKIYQKYSRRVKRFMEVTKHPTCFIRIVRTEEEISFIKKNQKYIYDVIKKGNAWNEIVFLLLKNMSPLTENFKWFYLDIDKYDNNYYELRTIFGYSKDFIEYYKEHILTKEERRRNILYDRETLSFRSKCFLVERRAKEYNEYILLALKNYFPDINEGVYIWGGGKFGNIMINYLLEKGLKVNAIIDSCKIKIGNKIKGISVIDFSEIEKDNINIFITISDEKAVMSVIEQIKKKCPNANVVSLDNIYGYANIPDLMWNF